VNALLLALLAAALYVASFPPIDAGWLAVVALAPWVGVARRLKGWRLFLVAYLAGAALLTVGCFWLRKSHPLNLVLMVVPEALAFALFALLLRRLHVARGWPAIVALPLAFVPVEFARGHWPLDGYPWLTLGYTQHAHLGLLQLATVAGVHGLSFVLAVAAGAIADACIERTRSAATRVVAVVLLLVAGEFGGKSVLLGATEGLERGPRLLLLQPAIPQKLKNSGAAGAEALERHVDLADRARAKQSCDLIVWSETLLPELWRDHDGVVAGEPPDFTRYRAAWREAVRRDMSERFGKPLLAGAVTIRAPKFDATTPILNSALLFDAKGRIDAAYDKRIRVPGGEYVPWIDHFSDATAEAIRAQIREMAGGVPNVLAGTRSGAIDLAGVGLAGKAGVTICYEIAYPQLGRELVAAGADWLINLSNEAWFPDSSEFEQYSAMAVVRAVEVRRTVVRCANSGTSGWIDPWGRPTWLEEGGRRDGFAGSLVVAPPIAGGTTPYVRWGDTFAWVVCGAAAIAALVRSQGSAPPRAGAPARPPPRSPTGG